MNLDSAHLVGFSDGGIIGLMMAIDHPERVRSLVSISANLDPSGFAEDDDIPSAQSMGYDDYDDEEAYVRLSPDGAEHRDVLIAKLTEMWLAEPRIDAAELKRITAPTLIVAGDGDSIATTHTVLIAESISKAQLCIIPNAGHLAILQRPDLINTVILEFLNQR
jgi:pimeloyl-ACP methyl ester carboxylesterase